ncbi:MAG: methyltransferase domain-containing protein [Chthoniobacteraceae bacterium]
MTTDWEDNYRRNDTPWDKGAPHPALVEFLKRSPVHGLVMVPGCGAGHDVRALAATADEVVGLDIAPSAISRAKAQPAIGGERYQLGDFFALPPSLRGKFDVVFEHTCFCAIDPSMREKYVAAVAGALQPEGHLLAIFYLDPGHGPGESGPPFEVTLAELDALFSPRFTLIHEWKPSATHPGREGREICRLLQLAS